MRRIRKSFLFALLASLFALALGAGASVAQAATLTGSPSSVGGGGAVTASWNGVASPTSQDWIGVYVPGASNSAYQNWLFDDSCTQSAGATTLAAGSCSIAMPAVAGTYELRLFANNSYTLLATSASITVNATSLTSSATTVGGGATVNVSWANVGNPTSQDWIAVYATGAANGAYQNWLFDDSCTQAPGTTALGSGSCSITMPSTSGTYELRLFANNSYRLLATSQQITVNATTLSATPTSAAPGGTVTANWSNVGNPSSTDWIGVYTPGAANSAYQGWVYDSNSPCTQTPGSTGVAAGSCQITMPTTPGTYELRLFASNSYRLLATSQQITVNAVPKITHVVEIWMENNDYTNVYGTSAGAYETSLANTYGLATNYYATGHFSLDNYLTATSGLIGVGNDDSCGSFTGSPGGDNIFNQLGSGNSINYVESGSTDCDHNPASQYADLGSGFTATLPSTPFSSTAFNDKYVFITPNRNDDDHDTSVATGDAYLSGLVPAIMATPQYQAGTMAIFIVFDESNVNDTQGNTTPPNNHVYLSVISPYTHAVKDATQWTHCSLLATTEDILGVSRLGCAAGAPTMVGHFGF